MQNKGNKEKKTNYFQSCWKPEMLKKKQKTPPNPNQLLDIIFINICISVQPMAAVLFHNKYFFWKKKDIVKFL